MEHVWVKDTVLVSIWVPGGSWHVEQDNLGIMGFVDNDLIELDSSVHPSDIGMVPEGIKGPFIHPSYQSLSCEFIRENLILRTV